MGSLYLHDLADICRRSGYPVIEVEGWQNRARGSGGYNSGKPDHVCVHHTASGASMDGWGDVNYMTFNHGDAPLCNLYLSRVPEIFVCAGGSTNTNGSGDCPHLSPDSMNSSAIGIEAGNNGVGEHWPDGQQDCYVALCKALCDGYGIPIDHVHGHAEWAPSRKIDMAGNSRYASGGNTWNFDQFRGDIAAGAPPEPEPPKPPEPEPEDDMANRALILSSGGGQYPGAVAVTDYTLDRKTFVSGDDAQALNKTGQYDWITLSGAAFDSIPGTTPIDIVGDAKGGV